MRAKVTKVHNKKDIFYKDARPFLGVEKGEFSYLTKCGFTLKLIKLSFYHHLRGVLVGCECISLSSWTVFFIFSSL
jgi:hypothetical protein